MVSFFLTPWNLNLKIEWFLNVFFCKFMSFLYCIMESFSVKIIWAVVKTVRCFFYFSIHAIASVPIVDCYQKILQQIKCYLKLSEGTETSELRKGLDVIDQTNLKYFNPEMISDFYALKGMFLNLLGESEEANRSFSAAVQFNDNSIKSWCYWGDYFRTVFLSSK